MAVFPIRAVTSEHNPGNATMATVVKSVSKTTIERLPKRIVIRVAHERNWLALIVLLVVFAFFLWGGSLGAIGLFSPRAQGYVAGLLGAWVIVCAILLGVLGLMIAWRLFGYEQITAQSHELLHAFVVGLGTWTKRYRPSSISDLRFEKDDSVYETGARGRVIVVTYLTFEHDGKTARMAFGITEDDAAQAISAIEGTLLR